MRAVFLHGRPGPHPFHAALAHSVGAEPRFVDPILPWHDRDCSAFRRYLSSLLCTLVFPGRSGYDLFLTEGAHVPPVLMRRLLLLTREQRTAALMDNETLYFVKSGYYPARTRRKILWLLHSFDALICIGSMQKRLADDVLLPCRTRPVVYQVTSAVPARRTAALAATEPSLDGNTILLIANGPAGFRSWYKGMDLLTAAFDRAASQRSDLALEIAGDWQDSEIRALRDRHPAVAARIRFLGHVTDLEGPLSRAALYVHLGRGDAFAISVLEAMAAGLPALVSEWTGASEAVSRVGPEWVVPLDAQAASARILAYFDMSLGERRRLSRLSREVAASYSEERAFGCFQEVVQEIVSLRACKRFR